MDMRSTFLTPAAEFDAAAGEFLELLDQIPTTVEDRSALWHSMPQVKRLMQRIVPDLDVARGPLAVAVEANTIGIPTLAQRST